MNTYFDCNHFNESKSFDIFTYIHRKIEQLNANDRAAIIRDLKSMFNEKKHKRPIDKVITEPYHRRTIDEKLKHKLDTRITKIRIIKVYCDCMHDT